MMKIFLRTASFLILETKKATKRKTQNKIPHVPPNNHTSKTIHLFFPFDGGGKAGGKEEQVILIVKVVFEYFDDHEG